MGRWLPWAGRCSFSLFFFCGMVVGYSFECFVLSVFSESSCWEPLVRRFLSGWGLAFVVCCVV